MATLHYWPRGPIKPWVVFVRNHELRFSSKVEALAALGRFNRG